MIFFLSDLQKLEHRAKKCIELHGEYVDYIPSLVAVIFLPNRAKDLSALPSVCVYIYIYIYIRLYSSVRSTPVYATQNILFRGVINEFECISMSVCYALNH